jgi:hypothetical protein
MIREKQAAAPLKHCERHHIELRVLLFMNQSTQAGQPVSQSISQSVQEKDIETHIGDSWN